MSLWCQSNIICLKDKKIWYRHLGNILSPLCCISCVIGARICGYWIYSWIQTSVAKRIITEHEMKNSKSILHSYPRQREPSHHRTTVLSSQCTCDASCQISNQLCKHTRFHSLHKLVCLFVWSCRSLQIYIHMHDKEYHTTHTRQTERINMIDINLCYG